MELGRQIFRSSTRQDRPSQILRFSDPQIPCAVRRFLFEVHRMYSLPKNVARERIDFSKIKTTVPIPNLIEIQKKSYERFLQMNRLPSEREDEGLQSVFKSGFPIRHFRE